MGRTQQCTLVPWPNTASTFRLAERPCAVPVPPQLPRQAEHWWLHLLGNTRKNVRIMQDILDRLIEAFGYESALLKTMIPQRTRLAEGRYGGQSVFEYCPGEDICQAFTNLADELLNRISILNHDREVNKEVVHG